MPVHNTLGTPHAAVLAVDVKRETMAREVHHVTGDKSRRIRRESRQERPSLIQNISCYLSIRPSPSSVSVATLFRLRLHPRIDGEFAGEIYTLAFTSIGSTNFHRRIESLPRSSLPEAAFLAEPLPKPTNKHKHLLNSQRLLLKMTPTH